MIKYLEDVTNLLGNVVVQVVGHHHVPGILAAVDGVHLGAAQRGAAGALAVLEALLVLAHHVHLVRELETKVHTGVRNHGEGH